MKKLIALILSILLMLSLLFFAVACQAYVYLKQEEDNSEDETVEIDKCCTCDDDNDISDDITNDLYICECEYQVDADKWAQIVQNTSKLTGGQYANFVMSFTEQENIAVDRHYARAHANHNIVYKYNDNGQILSRAHSPRAWFYHDLRLPYFDQYQIQHFALLIAIQNTINPGHINLMSRVFLLFLLSENNADWFCYNDGRFYFNRALNSSLFAGFTTTSNISFTIQDQVVTSFNFDAICGCSHYMRPTRHQIDLTFNTANISLPSMPTPQNRFDTPINLSYEIAYDLIGDHAYNHRVIVSFQVQSLIDNAYNPNNIWFLVRIYNEGRQVSQFTFNSFSVNLNRSNYNLVAGNTYTVYIYRPRRNLNSASHVSAPLDITFDFESELFDGCNCAHCNCRGACARCAYYSLPPSFSTSSLRVFMTAEASKNSRVFSYADFDGFSGIRITNSTLYNAQRSLVFQLASGGIASGINEILLARELLVASYKVDRVEFILACFECGVNFCYSRIMVILTYEASRRILRHMVFNRSIDDYKPWLEIFDYPKFIHISNSSVSRLARYNLMHRYGIPGHNHDPSWTINYASFRFILTFRIAESGRDNIIAARNFLRAHHYIGNADFIYFGTGGAGH
ncbi:MAG: hypothetical protein FWE03_05555 [Firmicutes bacterium]|nr:hypothetical protein [Bacillota bacterium]